MTQAQESVVSAPAVGTTPPSTAARRRRPGAPGQPRFIAYLYIAPAVIMFLLFVVGPIASTVNTAFYRWDGIGPSTWVGLDNFFKVLSDEGLRKSFVNSLVFVVFFSFIPVGLGLLIAALMGRHNIKGLTAYRVILFVPQVVAVVVSGIAWKWMYATDGSVNQILRAIGLGDFAKAWLGDFYWALPAIGLIGTWIMIGLTMILFLSGIQKIDPALYEAARMDGAGPVQEFFAVTLPGLRSEVAVALSITMIAALKTFDLVFVTTNGGPGTATLVPSISIYRLAFREGQVGLAAAIAVILAVIIGAVVLGINRFARKPE